jgi:hypothetical protein
METDSVDSFSFDAKRKKGRNASSPMAMNDDDYDAIFTASDDEFSPKIKKKDRVRKMGAPKKSRRTNRTRQRQGLTLS